MKKTKRWQSKQEFKARIHEWAIKLCQRGHDLHSSDASQMGILFHRRYPEFQ